jgi:hypothetical protein
MARCAIPFPHAQMAESLPPRLVALLEKLRTLEITAIVPAPPATNGTAATLDEAKAEFREN